MSYSSAARKEILQFLQLTQDVVTRLKAWCVQQHTTLRTIRANAFTVSMDDDLHSLVTWIQSWGPETPLLTETDPSWLKIKIIKWKINVALQLLDDHSDLESSTEDAWLDSLHLYLVDHGDRRRRSVLQQIREESLALISKVFGPHAGPGARLWGLPNVPLAELTKVLQDLSTHGGKMTKLMDTFRPRYITSYLKATDATFQVDPYSKAVCGTNTRVEKVTCQLTGRILAQKTFEPLTVLRKRREILNELAILELCHHPNIVTLVEAYEIAEDPGELHIVMEPWAPFTLNQFLYYEKFRRRECPWFRLDHGQSSIIVYQTMLKIAEAIGYLHKLSIKHKDIKPTNILLQASETGMVPYVTDVGVSKVYINGQSTQYTNSTYEFLAPEQVSHKHSSLAADVWQLGCCFAKLLALVKGGSNATFALLSSYMDNGRSCCIATEIGWFMQAFESIFEGGNAIHQHGHHLVKRMLHHDIKQRISIENVKDELRYLVDMSIDVENKTDVTSIMRMV